MPKGVPDRHWSVMEVGLESDARMRDVERRFSSMLVLPGAGEMALKAVTVFPRLLAARRSGNIILIIVTM